jgi:ankyrin repeat protein
MTSKDERGWTILHHLALAGSTAGVQVLLEAGADPKAKTAKGHTAAQLAGTLGWAEVVRLLGGK